MVAAFGAAASPAAASSEQESVFMDDDLLLYSGPSRTDATLRELVELGVDRVRVSVHWRSLAPRRQAPADAQDPEQYEAAAFDKYDHLVRSASDHGVRVLFNVTGPAPRWAGSHGGLFRPSAPAFGAFVHMLGRRYDGQYRDENEGRRPLPRVEAWSLWNEPNQGAFLQPQWVRRGKRWVPASPRLYRALARAAIRGLESSGHGDDLILLGETAPLGAERRGRSRAMDPRTFLSSLFCLEPGRLRPRRGDCGGALRVDGFAHHPYSVTSAPGRSRRSRREIALADRKRLYRILDAAFTAHRVPRGLPVWFTEYGYQTKPPDPYRGVSLAAQARWLADAERITFHDPRVAAHAQFLLRDDEPWTRFGPRDRRRWTTYQTGLLFEDGARKPAYDAYRLPLTAPRRVRQGQTVRLWGLVRPARGEATDVQVEFAAAGSDTFTAVGDPIHVTDPSNAFTTAVQPQGTGTWRFTWTPAAPAPPPPSLFSGLEGQPAAPAPAPLASLAVRVLVG